MIGRLLFSLLAAVLVAAPAAGHAQQLGGGEAFEPPLLRLTAGLVLCTLLAIAAAVALKRSMRGGASPLRRSFRALPRSGGARIRVLEAHRLSQHADVCVLANDEREYTVVVSASGATVLEQREHVAREAATP